MATPLTEKDLFATLSAGQDLTFTDSRFLLKDEATIFLEVASARKPGPNDGKDDGMCVLQIGNHSAPGKILDIRLSLDLSSLLVRSSESDTVSVKVDAKGSRLVLFFSGSKMRVFHIKSSLPEEVVSFTFGDARGALTLPQLRLGGKDGDAPFEGLIGDVMLFDKDIYPQFQALVANNKNASALLTTWVEGKPAQCFATWGLGTEDPLARSLVGVVIPTQNRFDFNPREILWPTGKLGRWMMEQGDQQPVKVILNDVDDQAEHSIYTTNGVYCFTRFGSQPYLWGDGNQNFALTYLGNNQFEGHSAAGSTVDQVITLTYKPDPANPGKPAVMVVTCVNWDNQQVRMFQTRIIPQNATLSAAFTSGVLYPKAFSLKLMPASYRLVPNSTAAVKETWTETFSSAAATVEDSSKGWDISKIDNVLNPGASISASKNSEYYLFPMPAGNSTDYRVDTKKLGTPFYCSSIDIAEGEDSEETKAFHSAREFSDKQGLSLGVGIGMGKESLLDCSFENTKTSGVQLSVDQSLVINKNVTRSHAVVLERQWLELSSDFLVGQDGLKDALAAITSATVPAPSGQYDKLFSLFDSWGTHYPNAITYGFATYGMAFIDEIGAAQMTASTSDNKIAIGVPIEEVMGKASIGWSNEKSANNETKTRSERYTGKTVGSEPHAVPLKLDLRPIVDLLQPPYMDENWALDKRMHIYTAIDQYYADRKKALPDGFALYEARLKSVVNHNPEPIYLTVRIFLAGVEPNSRNVVWPQVAKQRDETLRVWYCDKLRIEGSSTHDVKADDNNPAPGVFSILSVPLSQTGFVPSICMAGSSLHTENEVIRELLPQEAYVVPFATMPTWGPASDKSVKAEEDKISGVFYQSIDSLGVDWMTWNNGYGAVMEYAPNGALAFSTADLNSHVDFPALPDKGSIVTATLEIRNFTFNFEVRKVDMVHCFAS